ncbi:hypothetical protein [Yoonia sp. 2307UL14-13]|uniref:hypothetical protein n=1 Tax=Yoonia sp. 2307UL14-13 TaxID=3126506 RepID=UPI00309697EF
MNRYLPVLVLATLAGCATPIAVRVPTPPPPAPVLPPPSPEIIPGSAKERFLRAAAENGCEVNAQTSDAILASATLSRDDLARVVQELRNEGGAEVLPGGIRVTSGACA